MERGGHLGEQAQSYESWPNRHQKPDPLGYRRQRRGGCPRLRQRGVLGEQAIGEPGGNEQRIKSSIFRCLHHLPQVIESRRTLGPPGPGPCPIAVDGHEPGKLGFWTRIMVFHRSPR